MINMGYAKLEAAGGGGGGGGKEGVLRERYRLQILSLS